MRIAISAVIDRRLEHVVVARARRRVPALHLVPTRWLVAAARPMVPLLRRSLLRRAALAVGGAGTALSLAVLLVA